VETILMIFLRFNLLNLVQ